MDSMNLNETEPKMNETRLESWKEIGAYLQRNAVTVRRWEKEEGPRVVTLEPPVLAAIPFPTAAEIRPVLDPPVVALRDPEMPKPRPRRERVGLVQRERTDEATLAARLEAVEEVFLYRSFTLAEANALARDTASRRSKGEFRPPTIPEEELGLLMAGSGVDGPTGADPAGGPDTPVQEPSGHD